MYSAVLQERAATVVVVNESIKKRIGTTNIHLEKFKIIVSQNGRLPRPVFETRTFRKEAGVLIA